MATTISSSFILSRNGRKIKVKNRMCKAAMSESLASPSLLPSHLLYQLYRRWAIGGIGMLITGNVMIDRRYRELPRNVVLEAKDEEPSRLVNFKCWANACHATASPNCTLAPLAVMQISHPGRQCPRSVAAESIAPSAINLTLDFGMDKSFCKARAATEAEIEDVIRRFATTARLAEKANFDGVQIHAAHGYLISQFLSEKTNKRTDKWGGSKENRRRLLFAVIRAVKEVVSKQFIICVKLNSADFQKGGFSEQDSMEVVQLLSAEGIDFIEISGGNYENAKMMASIPDPNNSSSTSMREAFFIDFAAKVKKQATVPIMLTGGFRSKIAMNEALQSSVDIIGIARPLCLEPDLPNELIANTKKSALKYQLKLFNLRKVETILENFWHKRAMYMLATGQQPTYENIGYTYCAIMSIRGYIYDWGNISLFKMLVFVVLLAVAIKYWFF